MTVKQTIRTVLYAAVLPLPAALLALTACTADTTDPQPTADQQLSYEQAVAADNGPWLLSVALGGNPSAAATSGNEYVIVGGATRGNSYTPAGGTLTHGWQNVGQLHERNNSRVGLFTLTSGGNTVTDTSWEKFNVSTDATNGAQDYDAGYPAWTHLNTTGYGSNQLYYPEAKAERVDVYAYVPHVTQATMESTDQLGTAFTDISTQTVKYTLATDQTAENDYIDSDILWGKSDGEVSAQQFVRLRHSATLTGRQGAFIRRNNTDMQPDVALTMHHKTAKIVFRLTAVGMQQEKLQNAVVNINVPYITGQLNIKSGTFTATGDAAAAGNAVTMTSHLGIEAQGTTPTVQGSVTEGTPAKTYYCCSALIVPQTVAKAYHFTDITLYAKTTAQTTDTPTDDNWSTLNPPTANYSWTPSKEFTFESGKQYIFDITVTPQQLTVSTPYVLPWSDDSSFTNPSVDATQKAPLTVGVLLFRDGSWGSLTDNTSGQVKTADDAIGYVFSISPTEEDKAAGYTHGYAMALKDATVDAVYPYTGGAAAVNTRGMAWCQDVTYTKNTGEDALSGSLHTTLITDHLTGTWNGNFGGSPDGGTLNGTELRNALTNDMDGLTHCKKAKEWCTAHSVAFENLTAMWAAENYKNCKQGKHNANDGDDATKLMDGVQFSEWFLPSVGQWMAIMESTGIKMRTVFEHATQGGWDATPPTGFSFYRWQSNGDSQKVIAKLNEVMTNNGLTMGPTNNDTSPANEDYHFDKIRCGAFDGWCQRYWSSSEVCQSRPGFVWGMYFNYNGGSYDNLNKEKKQFSGGKFDGGHIYMQVRPVIAF